MSHEHAPYEIHVHGDIPIKPGTDAKLLQECLKPLWRYAGARSLREGGVSLYEEEPGLQFDAQNDCLRMCWTVRGNDDFRQVLDELCMNLNEVSSAGAQIEVSFYDADFDEDEEDDNEEARDDFVMLFVGPNPQAILQVQRDLLVNDVVHMMERHFDAAELGGVIEEVDKLFVQRLNNLVSSLDLGRPPRGSGGSGHGGGRRPRHLH